MTQESVFLVSVQVILMQLVHRSCFEKQGCQEDRKPRFSPRFSTYVLFDIGQVASCVGVGENAL